MRDFDSLWNYNDPAGTELKFKEVLAQYLPANDMAGHIQLQTQIARTYSLRRMFHEAHELLDTLLPILPQVPDIAHIRYHLERGRTYNSFGNKAEARVHFKKALQIAEHLQEDFYAIDTMHMLAIVSTPEEAVLLNEQAIQHAEATHDPKAKNWLGSLYNNLAWAYFEKGLYAKALEVFERALAWRQGKQSAPEIFIAKWSVARTLRALGRTAEALAIQTALLHEMETNNKPDGYVYEELGELYHLQANSISKEYFKLAHNQLSRDSWFVANEPARLQRMIALGA